ncbi:hypothetical protein QA599_05145 [Haloarculaceae archaeon H-GB1-1]|nr:hypothetical protein [Haloarculaceae archaeon H-GB1-1]
MVAVVTLYRSPTTNANAEAIASWLQDRVPAAVTVRDRFCSLYADDELADAFANARVLSPYERETGTDMLGIVRYERRALDAPERAGGVVYDGFAVQRALRRRLPPDERSLQHLHVPLLGRVIGTWGTHDGRWHKRVHVLGPLTPVSVPGLYEAPAKPESYYKAKQQRAMVAGDTPPREVLESEVDGDFLVEDDHRTADVLKGYVLQAYHYLTTGEAFCDDESCRLANPHRQSGVIDAQVRSPEFCAEHAATYEPSVTRD